MEKFQMINCIFILLHLQAFHVCVVSILGVKLFYKKRVKWKLDLDGALKPRKETLPGHFWLIAPPDLQFCLMINWKLQKK